jgi:large subunit ribosomal protein L7/L12
MAHITYDGVIEWLSSQSMLAIATLAKDLESKLGMSVAAPVAVAAPGASGAFAAPLQEEQTPFTVLLKTNRDKKIEAIKALRELTGLGLQNAKDSVESAPKPLKEGISKTDATDMKRKLDSVGASV